MASRRLTVRRGARHRVPVLLAVAVALLGASTVPGAAEDPYDLAPGDRISITVFDQPDISGSYIVEPDGQITMPLVGQVGVTTMTPHELQAELVKRFSSGYLQNPAINVRLTELRPVTIVGEVRSPGRYTFIDGMSVQTAISLAGGAAQLTSEESAQRLEMLRSQERLESLTATELVQRVREDRLEAQFRGDKTFDTKDADPRHAVALQRLVATERQTMAFEVTAQADQVSMMAQQIQTLQSDIQSYAQQADLEKAQITILESELSDVSGLLKNGWTKKSPVQELQREESRTQSNLLRILGDLARSKSALAEATVKAQELGPAYQNRLATELQSVRLVLDETRNGLRSVRDDLKMREARLPFATRDDARPSVFQISRYVQGRIASLVAGPETALRPGDILQVGDALSGGGGAMPATAGSDRQPDAGAGADAGEGRPALADPGRASSIAPRSSTDLDRLSQR